jgi:hypothetical protein
LLPSYEHQNVDIEKDANAAEDADEEDIGCTTHP